MKAFIFDLNGTMVHDMDYHTQAWQHIFNNELGGNFSYDEVKPQMYGKNAEVLERVFGPARFTAEEVARLSQAKEQRYQEAFRPHLQLLPGLTSFLAAAHARGIKLAIGSAAIPSNIDFVVDGLDLRAYFPTIVSADDVTLSKPHPETFLKAAQLLDVAPADCLVFEDVPKGVEAAARAGMAAIVLTTTHPESDFAGLTNVRHFAPNFTSAFFRELLS